jgi:hypothetical protein
MGMVTVCRTKLIKFSGMMIAVAWFVYMVTIVYLWRLVAALLDRIKQLSSLRPQVR